MFFSTEDARPSPTVVETRRVAMGQASPVGDPWVAPQGQSDTTGDLLNLPAGGFRRGGRFLLRLCYDMIAKS